MYGLAGYVIEQLKGGGLQWEDLVQTYLLEPLGMTSTIASDNIEDWSQVATPYVLHESRLFPVDKQLIRYSWFGLYNIIRKIIQSAQNAVNLLSNN